ncbi:YxeA family protein [Bacillus mycoides]|uniref:YxeA family protein n=1 Tax=Bacillus mycoides TaxID=1405 RepID=UPI003558323A
MKKIFALFAILTVFAVFSFGCDIRSLKLYGKGKYYVQIKGEGEIKDKTRVYTLPAYDEEGAEKKISFTSHKAENDKKLKEDAFLRLYVSEDNDKSVDVKSYEEVKKEDLPEKVKKKLNVK